MQACVGAGVQEHFQIDLSEEAKASYELIASATRAWLATGEPRGRIKLD
jgi:hypothetical protein